MKRKIRFVDNINNKVTETEVVVRDFNHFLAQKTLPALVQQPKKGKGSFKRHTKYKNTHLFDEY